MGKMLAQPGVLAHGCRASRRIGVLMIGRALFCVATLGVGCLAAQEPLRIRVAPRIIATAESQAALAIEVGPPGAVPPRSFLSLRGLPPTIVLSDAHSIGPGSWAVPLAGLPALKAMIPAGVSGESEVTISLIAMDGRLLNQAKTTLVIQRSSAGIVPGSRPAGPPAAAAGTGAPPPLDRTEGSGPVPSVPVLASQKPLAPQERQRALGFLKKGQDLFAAGNVGAARLFYERAADAGLPEGALALAATFDPDELARRRVVGGVQPDRAAARRWYERARELGAPEAESRLNRLGARER